MKILTLLLAGSFFLSGLGGTVKRDVTVNGISVGGMSEIEAVERVRAELEYPPLLLRSPKCDIYAELSYSDDAEKVVKQAKRGENLTVRVARNWVNLEQIVDMVCRKNAKEPQNATVTFSADGFFYCNEQNGTACDRARFLADIYSALENGEREVELCCYSRPAAVTRAMLEARTQLLSRFSTDFNCANLPRSHNIALAASRISGTTLKSGEEFSFNRTVGKRTAENGFEEAAIISGGEFVAGVGGGVCQVSTTLYGAALRAGLVITECRGHSLSVGYVPPSQDAMVSEYSDFKFKNNYPYPVYLQAEVEGGTIAFSVYGMPSGKSYEVESKVLSRIEPPAPEITEGKEDRVVRPPRKGLTSECYLCVYERGVLLRRVRIRKDAYACVQGIEERAPKREEEGNGARQTP